MFYHLLVYCNLGLVICWNFAQDVHQKYTELDDFHILCLFDARLNERIWDIDNRGVPIFLGIDDSCQKGGLCGDSGQASILLGNVSNLYISSVHSLALDFYVLILL